MTEDIFIFDTYALIEIMNKNRNYENYISSEVIINNFIFAEFCYKLFREDVKGAENYIQEVVPAIIHADSSVVKEAMIFRVKYKKRKMSMTDCISYMMAKNMGIKFLTGDKEFENFDNVEFVK